MNSLTLRGTFFKQNSKSPVLFSCILSADEILRFCGVARKEGQSTHQYQRVLDQGRVTGENGTSNFFRQPENCSPTAIVIGLKSTKVSKIEYKYENGKEPKDDMLPVNGEVIVTFPDFSTMATDEARAKIKEEILSRLSKEDQEIEEEEPYPAETGDENEDDDDEDDTDALDGMHESRHRNIVQKIDDITPAGKLSDEDIGVLKEMLKPGLIIDGQHRVFGAASLGRKHPFVICAICDSTWQEQVFQFCILNLKAVPISKPFVSSVIGLSLNTVEIQSLSQRLIASGLNLQDALIMQQIGMNADSPFYERIDFKHKKRRDAEDEDGLGYQTMLTCGKKWYSPSKHSSVLKKIIKLILKTPGTKVGKTDIEKYLQDRPDNRWYMFFKYFWDKVKEKYETDGLWKVDNLGEKTEDNKLGRKYNLYTAVVLEEFQNAFFKKLTSSYEDNFESDEFKEKLEKANSLKTLEEVQAKREEIIIEKFLDIRNRFLNKFPKEKFESFKGSLNQAEGRKILLRYFEKVTNGESTSNDAVFR